MDIDVVLSKLKLSNKDTKILDIHTLLVTEENGFKVYSVDKAGKYKMSALYTDIISYNDLSIARVKNDRYWGIIKFNLDEIVKPIYKSIDIYDNTFIMLNDGEVTGVFDKEFNQLIPSIYRSVQRVFKGNNKYYLVLTGKENNSTICVFENNKATKIQTNIVFIQDIYDDRILGTTNSGNICDYNTITGEYKDIVSINKFSDDVTVTYSDELIVNYKALKQIKPI